MEFKEKDFFFFFLRIKEKEIDMNKMYSAYLIKTLTLILFKVVDKTQLIRIYYIG